MTRTARMGSKLSALPATPWAKLKAGYKHLQDSDMSDCDIPGSRRASADVDPTLRVCKKERLKKTKDKVSAKIKSKKLSRKQLEESDIVPLLSEVTEVESNPKAHIVKTRKPRDSTSTKKKKHKKSKSRSEDTIPLIPDADNGTSLKEDMIKLTVGTKPNSRKQGVVARKSHTTVHYQRLRERDEEEWKKKRTEARRLRRQRLKLVCFNCREPGHRVSECKKSRETTGTGICFKCGSSSHTSKKCRANVPEGEYPYAKCFVCGEIGHLSGKCPENPKGLYPHGGGCNLCGSVEHFMTNCPRKHRSKQIKRHQKDVTGQLTGTGSHSSADIEDFDTEPLLGKQKHSHTKPIKSGPKVVSF